MCPKKKTERIKETIEAYYNFVDAFPNSKKIKEAESLYKNLTLEKQKTEQKKI